jgi:hypothetical protein
MEVRSQRSWPSAAADASDTHCGSCRRAGWWLKNVTNWAGYSFDFGRPINGANRMIDLSGEEREVNGTWGLYTHGVSRE